MYLKSLEISGFKSFAEKTVLSFLPGKKGHQSITAIVGPNGSGKSNVADAIRWILGEQSMKALRGKKSGDIIFSGSDAKGKMSAASATLTIDNSDKKLPVDYDELVITRKVYASGDNEYLINGNKVRLLDLQILLAKSQFGQGSYSVIGQGMIDRLLLQSTRERKDFFDEAFGIKEFQIKRHQAVLKLDRTRDNISQAEALLNEVSPRLKSLSRQVKKLEERQEVETSLMEAQESYYVTLANNNKNQLDDLNQKLGKIEISYKKTHNELQAVQGELADLAKESSRQDVYNSLQSSIQEISRSKYDLEREQATLSGRMQVEYSREGKQNIGWLEKKIEQIAKDETKLSSQISTARNESKDLQKSHQATSQELQDLTIRKTELKSRLASLETSLSEVKSEQQIFHLTGLKAVQAILDNREQFGRIFGAVAQLAQVETKFQLAMDVAAGSHLSSIVVPDDHVAELCISYLRSEQLGVATFLPISKIRPRPVPQNIQELLHKKGVHGLATDLASFDERFSNIFSYVFGSTLIVDNLDVAREIGIGKIRMVTLDGDVIETSGSMKGGYRRKRQRGLSFSDSTAPHLMQAEMMDHAEKIEKTKQELDSVESEQIKIEKDLRATETKLEVHKQKLSLLETQKQDVEQELAGLKQERSLTTMSAKDYSSAMKEIGKQKKDIDSKIIEIGKKLAQAEQKLTRFHEEEEKKKKRIFALQDQMQKTQNELNKISNEKQEKQIALAKLETKQEDLENEVYQELNSSLESILKRNKESVELGQLEALQTNIQKLKYKLSLIGGIDEEVVAEYEETRERHEGLSIQLDDLEKAMKDLEKLVVELDEMMKKRRAKAFKEIKKEFSRYFKLLFDGGKADLLEVYGEENTEETTDEAERSDKMSEANFVDESQSTKKRKGKKILTGIEITACPPGKKIKNISALSGGERTMTSIALICAILHTNPPPFVVLDEVEAALDEANTSRFTKILKELSEKSQFVLITHNRVTMHAVDALYGVTMGNDGISHLLSVKLEQAEKQATKA